MKEIQIIKKNYKDVIFVFEFFDRFAEKMKKVSVTQKTSNTLVFQDYYDEQIYYVLVDKVNSILDYCYSEYFFKIILSGSIYYEKVKKISDDLGIEPPIFDLFFRSFFLAIKKCYNLNDYYGFSCTKDYIYRIVYNSHSDSFDELPKIDIEYYCDKAAILLDELEEQKLVCYKTNDITRDLRLRSYFPISCDTFRFAITNEFKGYEISMPMFDFLDLKRYLDNQDFLQNDLLTRLDRTVQTLIVISFQDVKFNSNEFSDNSYLKQLIKEKKKRTII